MSAPEEKTTPPQKTNPWGTNQRLIWFTLTGLAFLWSVGLPSYLWYGQWDQQLHVSVRMERPALSGTLWPLQVNVLGSDKPFRLSWHSQKRGGKTLGQSKPLTTHLTNALRSSKRIWLRLPTAKRDKRIWLRFREQQCWFCRSRSIPIALESIADPPVILVTLSKPIYQPGEMVHVRLHARSQQTGKALGNIRGELRLTTPNKEKSRYPLHISTRGVGQARFVLPQDAKLGRYQLAIRFNGRQIKGSFVVSRYTLPAFRVSLRHTKRKTGATLELAARYAHGSPVANADVTIRIEQSGKIQQSNAKTDAQGRYTLRLPSKTNKAIVATMQVRDRAGRVESAQHIVSSRALPAPQHAKRSYELIGVEGGTIVPNVTGRLTLRSTPADDVRGTLQCHRQRAVITCRQGICQVELALAQPPTQCTITTKNKGTKHTTHIPLLRWLYQYDATNQRKTSQQLGYIGPTTASIPGQARTRGLLRINGLDQLSGFIGIARPRRKRTSKAKIARKAQSPRELQRATRAYWHGLSYWHGRLRLTQHLATAGKKLQGSVLLAPGRGPRPQHVIMVKHSQQSTQLIARAKVNAKNGSFSLSLPKDHQGIFWLLGEGGSKTPFVPTRLVLQPSLSVGIKTTTDRKHYQPGQQVKMALQLRDHEGKATGATLGVEAVDARILALRGRKDSFLQWALPYLNQLTPVLKGSLPRTAMHNYMLGGRTTNATTARRQMAISLASSAQQPQLMLRHRWQKVLTPNRSKWQPLPPKEIALGTFGRKELIELWWTLPLIALLILIIAWLMIAIARKVSEQNSSDEDGIWAQRRGEIEQLDDEQVSEDNTKVETHQTTAFSLRPNRLFASLLLGSLVIHIAMYQMIQSLGPLPERQPAFGEFSSRFARLIISPSGLALYQRDKRSTAERKRTIKPKHLPTPKLKRKPVKPLGLKRYINRKGLLALIGTPKDSKELKALLRGPKLKRVQGGQTSGQGLSASYSGWSTSTLPKRKRPLRTVNTTKPIAGATAHKAKQQRKRAKRIARQVRVPALLGQLGTSFPAGGIITAKGFGNIGEGQGIASLDMALASVRKGRRKTSTKGPPSAAPKARIRSAFPEILFWKPEWVIPSSGRGKLQFRVGDAITQWHLRFFGLSDKGAPIRYVKTIRVFQPFFIECQTPKTMIKGDETTVSLVLTSHETKTVPVTLSVHANNNGVGAALDTKKLKLKPKETRAIKLTLKARELGTSRLTITAQAGTERDAVQRVLQIRPQGEPIKVTYAGRIATSVDEEITIPKDAIPGTLSLKVRLLQLEDEMLQATKAILRRPYGCFEQTTSSTAPNILAYHILKAQGKQESPKAQQALRNIRAGYYRMQKYEHLGGGFSLYGRGQPSLHLTAYGYRVLREIHQITPVDQALLLRTKRWLISQQKPDGSFGSGLPQPIPRLRETALVRKALGAQTRAAKRAVRWLSAILPKVAHSYDLALVMTALPGSFYPRLLQRILAHMKPQRNRTYPTLFGGWGNIQHQTTKAMALQTMASMSLKGTQRKIEQKWLKELVRNRSFGGGWSNTELTLESLRALKAQRHSLTFRPIRIRVTSSKGNTRFRADVKQPGELDLIKALNHNRGGKLQLHFAPLKGVKSNSFYQIDLSYHPRTPPPPKRGPLALVVRPDKTDLRVGEQTHVTVQLHNRRNQRINAPMVVLGIPPGMIVDKATKRTIIRRQETRNGKLYLYLGSLPPKGKATFRVGMTARFQGRALSGIHQAYPYYNSHLITTLPSFRTIIR